MKNIFLKSLMILIGLFIGIFLSILALEVALRLCKKDDIDHCLFQKPSDAMLEHVRSKYRPSSLLGYEHVPNNSTKINSYGMVGKEYPIKKTEGIYRILILGDSIAEQEWSADHLEDCLNADKDLGRLHRFEIWNAGTGSYDVRRYALFLQYRGLALNPDMVIIFLFMNDFCPSTMVYYKTKEEIMAYDFKLEALYKKGFSISPFLMQYSSAYRYMIVNISRYLSKEMHGGFENTLEYNGRYYLSRIKKLCERRNLPLYLIIFPYLNNFEAYNDKQKQEYRTITRVLKEMNLNYINLYDLYDKLIKENFNIRHKEQDDMHPSEAVHRLIAEDIYKYLKDKLTGIE